MSHFTRIKTQIVERENLLKALEDLGYTVETGELKVRGLAGDQARVNIKIKLRLGREVGFRKQGETYEIVADPWGLGTGLQDLVQKVTQRYAYRTAVSKLEAQGFTLVSEENIPGEQIHLTLRRMA